ncbi:MAG: thioredoxin family protein [Armatimonadota bacterium]
MRFTSGIACLLVLFALALSGLAAEMPPPPTVEREYLGLSSGPLRQARLTALPQGILLRTETLTITDTQFADKLTAFDTGLQAQLTKHAFFLLEQMALKPLLVAEARAWAAAQKREAGEEEDAVLQAYLRSIADRAAVSDEELKAAYEESKDALGGMTYAQVEKELREVLLDEKRGQLVDAWIGEVSARVPVEVDATWLKARAATSLDNPVDKARRAGKPALIDFGADNCGPCRMMAPTLKHLQETLAEKCTVLVVNVREEEVLAARYGVEVIPVQIFFDKDGKEVFRHVNYYSREQILEQLAKLGVK